MNEHQKCYGCYLPLEEGFYHPKCALKLFGKDKMPSLDSTIHEVDQAAHTLLSQRLSVTGVQRKLSLQLDSENKNRITILDTLGGGYIMKPPSPEYDEMPEIEDLTMHLAEICKIKTASHGLIPLKDGAIAYITKRFDRNGNTKIHVEDMCQLSELLTEQKYRSSYEKIGKILKEYSSLPGDDLLRYFEVVLHSFITGNNDMHLKNFSLFTDANKRITLTPAYDLIAVRLILSKKEDPEEMALHLNGKKNKITFEDFISFGENLGIPTKVVEKTMARQCKLKDKMEALVDRSFLSIDKKEQFTNIIGERIGRLRG